MDIKKLTPGTNGYPEVLRHIAGPPKQLFHCGAPLEELLQRPAVAIVGTRRVTSYGQQTTLELAGRLAEQGVVVISGLAFGVDALAHKAVVDAGGKALAVLPSPLDRIIPVRHRHLAERILQEGGALVSEYGPGDIPFKQNFVARNRLMSGLANAVLIVEAGEKSGALHTANFALDQGREVLAVPGNIKNTYSIGTNNLIKAGKAGVATSYTDVLNVLGLKDHQTPIRAVKGRNRNEQTVLDLLLQGVHEGDSLIERSGLTVSEFNQVLTMLEIGAKIRPLGGNRWALY